MCVCVCERESVSECERVCVSERLFNPFYSKQFKGSKT